MKLLQALRNASEGLKKEIADSNLVEHLGERGRFREFAIQRLLRPHLPKACGIGTGQVFDRNGTSSKQMDVVLYDDVFGNVLFRDQSLSLFPCECVYGALEIKSYLDFNELERSVDNSKSLKVLERADASGLTITLFYQLELGTGLRGPSHKMNHYFHGIVALSSVAPSRLADELTKRIPVLGQSLPDYVWVYDPGIFILALRAGDGGTSVPATLAGTRQYYASIKSETDTLPLMILALNTLIGQIRLRAPNYNEYFVQTINDVIRASA